MNKCPKMIGFRLSALLCILRKKFCIFGNKLDTETKFGTRIFVCDLLINPKPKSLCCMFSKCQEFKILI